ncbi:MAG: metallophosphoesterase, partial [Alphaproteobacteria bacterium]
MHVLLRPFARFHTPRPPPRVPEGVRVYAFGDVHGRADLLEILLGTILREAAGVRCEVIGLGDYLDRGPDSRRVLDLLMRQADLPRNVRLTPLRGNHEEAFLMALADPGAMSSWLEFGGVNTLLSYGLSPIVGAPTAERIARLREALVEAFPTNHLAFLKGMSTHLHLGDYYFVHAGIRPGRPLDRQRDED